MKFCIIHKIITLLMIGFIFTFSFEALALDFNKDVKINIDKFDIDSFPLDFAGIKHRENTDSNFWENSNADIISGLIVSTDVTKIPKVFINDFYSVVSTGGRIEKYSSDGQLLELKLSKLILGNQFALVRKIILSLPYEYQEDYIFSSKKIEMKILQYSFEQNCLIANNELSKKQVHYIYRFISAVCEIKSNREKALLNLNYYLNNSQRPITPHHRALIKYLVDNKKTQIKTFLPELFKNTVTSLDIFLMYKVAQDYNILFDFYPAALYFYTKNSKKLGVSTLLRLLEYDLITFSKFQKIVMSSKSKQIGHLKGIFKSAKNSSIAKVSNYVSTRNDAYLPLLKELYTNNIPLSNQEKIVAGLLSYLEDPSSLIKNKVVRSSKIYPSLKLFEELHQKKTNKINFQKNYSINTFQLYKSYIMAKAYSGHDFMLKVDRRIINIAKTEKNYFSGYRYRDIIRLRDRGSKGEVILRIYRIISNPQIDLSVFDMSLIIETLNSLDAKNASHLARYFMIKKTIT